MSKPGIIFDGDDTLWETSVLYSDAKERFFLEMERLGFSRTDVQPFFDRTDFDNALKYGFKKERFPLSMTETYIEFCKREPRQVEVGTERNIKAIGESVFRGDPVLVKGVDEVLGRLKPHFVLLLATKGNKSVQASRIRESGLERFFSSIFIVKNKSEREFRRIITSTGILKRHSWSVGNSLKADINPALRVGLSAIWIPNPHTWNFEHEEPIESPNFFKADSLQDAVKYLMH